MGDSSVFIRLLRRIVPVLAVGIALAVIYDGSVFYGRWQEARTARQAQAARESQDDRRTVEMLGGDRLKIIEFYASPAAIRRGQTATICYGVNAASSVRVDPSVEQLHPAVSHCFQVTPGRDTEYKLTVADAAGHALTQSLTVKVAP